MARIRWLPSALVTIVLMVPEPTHHLCQLFMAHVVDILDVFGGEIRLSVYKRIIISFCHQETVVHASASIGDGLKPKGFAAAICSFLQKLLNIVSDAGSRTHRALRMLCSEGNSEYPSGYKAQTRKGYQHMDACDALVTALAGYFLNVHIHFPDSDQFCSIYSKQIREERFIASSLEKECLLRKSSKLSKESIANPSISSTSIFHTPSPV